MELVYFPDSARISCLTLPAAAKASLWFGCSLEHFPNTEAFADFSSSSSSSSSSLRALDTAACSAAACSGLRWLNFRLASSAHVSAMRLDLVEQAALRFSSACFALAARSGLLSTSSGSSSARLVAGDSVRELQGWEFFCWAFVCLAGRRAQALPACFFGRHSYTDLRRACRLRSMSRDSYKGTNRKTNRYISDTCSNKPVQQDTFSFIQL